MSSSTSAVFGGAVNLDALVDDLAQLLLAHQEIDLELEAVVRIGTIHKAQILRDRAG